MTSEYVTSTASTYPFDCQSFQESRLKGGGGGGVEYLILNFHSSRVHVQWNVQSIGDIISFRIYDSYFHHDIRGHGAGVTPPISMRVDLVFFCFVILRFSCRFFPPFLTLSLSSYFPFYWAFISYFCFGLAYSLRQAGLLKKDKVKVDFQNSIFQVFFGI